MTGTLSILNAGKGDLKLSQGYAIVVAEEDGTHSLVREFDAEHDEYLVGARDAGRAEAKRGEVVDVSGAGGDAPASVEDTSEKKAPPRKGRRRVKASKAKATAVAPSAGG